jgi:hypothetical protein
MSSLRTIDTNAGERLIQTRTESEDAAWLILCSNGTLHQVAVLKGHDRGTGAFLGWGRVPKMQQNERGLYPLTERLLH